MAKEYIEREAVAKKAICMYGFGNAKYVPLSAITNQTTADVVEVKHGRWIEEIEFDCRCRPCGCHFRCSICNKVEDDATHYCPNCGATMDGGNNDV